LTIILSLSFFPNNKAQHSFGFLSIASIESICLCASVRTKCKTIQR